MLREEMSSRMRELAKRRTNRDYEDDIPRRQIRNDRRDYDEEDSYYDDEDENPSGGGLNIGNLAKKAYGTIKKVARDTGIASTGLRLAGFDREADYAASKGYGRRHDDDDDDDYRGGVLKYKSKPVDREKREEYARAARERKADEDHRRDRDGRLPDKYLTDYQLFVRKNFDEAYESCKALLTKASKSETKQLTAYTVKRNRYNKDGELVAEKGEKVPGVAVADGRDLMRLTMQTLGEWWDESGKRIKRSTPYTPTRTPRARTPRARTPRRR